jgi:hypothetical protein
MRWLGYLRHDGGQCLFALLLVLRPAVGVLGLVWVQRTNPALSRVDRGRAVTVDGSLRRIS